MKKRRVVVALAVVLILMAALSAHAAGIFDFSSKNRQTVTITREEYDRMLRYQKMDTILQYIEEYYYQEPDVDALIENATRGLMYGLEDPYSFYYNEQEWAEMWEDDEGEYAGIGLNLLGNYEDYSVTVTRVFDHTPAKEAGVRKGDLLVRVEDIEVTYYTLQNAVNVMRGQVGEEVEIEVKRGDEYLTFKIPRAIIHVNRIDSMMLEDNVGYIALYEFAGDSQTEFAQAYDELKKQGAQALVVDLRDNGGGWVEAAVSIADIFLDEGVLVYSSDRYGARENYKTKAGKDDIPLVMLVNENSASSSEILSGGLQDRGRATVVGVQTYGKGILQTVLGLNDNKEGFQMTCAQYFLSSGKAVHKVGITPDVISEMPEDRKNAYFQFGDLADPQLLDAWNIAKARINP